MSAPEPKPPYCGNPPMNLGNLFRSNRNGGVLELFSNRRAAFSFNARTAIRQACDLLGLQRGDEILVPAYNCGSEIDPLFDAGLMVRMYPVADNLKVRPEDISKLITSATKAVYITHYFGFLQENLSEVRALCDDHGLRLIEDCALSLLSGDMPVDGRTGDVSIFCFYKFFPVIGGGALVVNATDLPDPSPFSAQAPAKYVRRPLFRSLVASVLGSDGASLAAQIMRYLKPLATTECEKSNEMPDIPAGYYFDTKLRNARMSMLTNRILGAFNVEKTVESRRKNWALYAELLEGIPDASPMLGDLPENTCPLGFPVVVSARDTIVASLQKQGISVSPWWAGFHKKLDWNNADSAIRLKNTVILLPLHNQMGAHHIRYIAGQLQKSIRSRA